MKHKWIIISLAVIFFLSALTFYANRVLLPTFVKKIAIEQAAAFLKRKIEIESLHFNWIRGISINKIKIYQKDSTDQILAQAERISSGIIFIPGFKKHKLIFPNLNIQSLSLYLIHEENNNWNFSDLLSNPNGASSNNHKPSPIDISVGGVTIMDGKLRLEDKQPQGIWSEFIDQINLKAGLSISGIGIAFDGSLAIPKKQGFISLSGTYTPANQTLKSDVIIKNIKPVDYLSLLPIKLPLTLASATIKEVNAQVDYAPENINVHGHWSIKNMDATFNEHNVKADLDLTNADISIKKNSMSLKGVYAFANTQILTPQLTLAGSFKANVDSLLINFPDEISLKANLSGGSIQLKLPNEQSISGNLSLQINHSHWQKDSSSFNGDLILNQASVSLNDQQTLTGNLEAHNIKLRKDKQTTTVDLDLNIKRLNLRSPRNIFKTDLQANHLNIQSDEKNTYKLNSTLDLTNIDSSINKTAFKGSIHLAQLNSSFNQEQQTLETKTKGTLEKLSVKLDEQKELTTDAHFDIQLSYPIKHPSDLTYRGTASLENAILQGLPFGDINNINLKAAIKTNSADIQSLTLNLLDTPIVASGHLENFSKPFLSIEAESKSFDLSKLKTLAPELLKPYGLTVDGNSAFKIKFEGKAHDPLSAKINAVANLKDVNVESATLKQSLKNISGTIKADGNSLSWDDFTATYMDKTATLTGYLTDFKNPKVSTTCSMEGIELKGKFDKNGPIIDIKSFSGHYLSAQVNANGSVDLSNKTPQLNLKSDLKFKLEDLGNLLPSTKKTVDPFKLTGLMAIQSSITGPTSNWKDWMISANATSDLVTILGFKFDTLHVDLNQEEGKIKKFNMTSSFYEGSLNIVTTADLKDEAIPFETAVHLENANIAKFKNDTAAKDEDLRGFVAFTSMLNGTVKNTSGMTGNGALNISQGYLMKKEFSSLFLIPELNNLIFTDATASFTVADQKVSTENFVLKSEGANLNGKGWISFDKKIQFQLHPEFNSDTIAQSGSLKKGPSAIIALAASKYITINIDGNLDKPTIRTVKKPTELLKKTGEILKENVGQILEGIFQ